MSDLIEKMGNSLIQHGKDSDRIYLMKLSKDDVPQIITSINGLARDKGYTKIFAKVPEWGKAIFELDGYRREAYIPKFYGGKEDVFFMSKFSDEKRKLQSDSTLIAEILALTEKLGTVESSSELPENYKFVALAPKDSNEMTQVYKRVFDTYPFPIFNSDYLTQTMNDNIVYFGMRDKDALIAIASCEMDVQAKNVEMTDFATLPEYRSKGIASFLLRSMEEEMKKRGIVTAYTIARAVSYGMNITFAKHQYTFTGTLTNNTNISGGIESMNVWYKFLEHK